jgi:hypothetical protein
MVKTRRYAGLNQLGPVHGNARRPWTPHKQWLWFHGPRPPRSISARVASSKIKRKVRVTLPTIRF